MRSLQASEVTRKNRRTSRIILSRRVAQISRSKSLPSDTAREKKEGKFLPSYYSVKYDASNSCIYSIYAKNRKKEGKDRRAGSSWWCNLQGPSLKYSLGQTSKLKWTRALFTSRESQSIVTPSIRPWA